MVSGNGKQIPNRENGSIIIETLELEKHYVQGDDLIRAVDRLTLEIAQGDFVTITGRSGSGKTTLLSLIGGLTKPTSGTVKLFGHNIFQLEDDRLSAMRSSQIGFVFQFSSLISTLSVFDNVRLPGLFSNLPVETKRVKDLLTWVDLGTKINNYPNELSGGQQARVALARALANSPELLLADEPTGNLDVETELEILELLREINEQEGTTIMLVTHNPDLAKFGSRHMVMEKGKLAPYTKTKRSQDVIREA
ncbi:ABC transporter ATP-binding protein [Chloroflexota bacterium]